MIDSFPMFPLHTSAVREGEIPGSSPCWSGKAGQGSVTLQHIARAAAVADFVPNVKRRPLLVAIE